MSMQQTFIPCSDVATFCMFWLLELPGSTCVCHMAVHPMVLMFVHIRPEQVFVYYIAYDGSLCLDSDTVPTLKKLRMATVPLLSLVFDLHQHQEHDNPKNTLSTRLDDGLQVGGAVPVTCGLVLRYCLCLCTDLGMVSSVEVDGVAPRVTCSRSFGVFAD